VSSNDESTDVQLDIGNETTKELLNDSVMLLDVVTKVHHARDKMCENIYENGMDLSDFPMEEQIAWVVEILKTPLLLEEVKTLQRKLMLAESALGEIRAYHESGQGNLGEIIEHYQENEQVEMPNAFDEED